MRPNLQFPMDLVTFTEEILNAKLYFLCSAKGHSKTMFTKMLLNLSTINLTDLEIGNAVVSVKAN